MPRNDPKPTGILMRTAIYARVSTDNKERDKTTGQTEHRQKTGNQVDDLKTYCERQGWPVVAVYEDRVTGSTSDRPEFKRMLQDAAKRKYDLLLFWSLDRLSREGVLATLQHLEALSGYGIRWKSYTEQYLDSIGPFKDAVLAILAVVAKQERVRLSERVKAGMDRARREGRSVGRARCKVNPSAFQKALAAGMSLSELAQTFGVSRATAQRRKAELAE